MRVRHLLSFPPIDIFSQGKWAALSGCQDPELQELARRLPSTVLHNRANSAVNKYLAAFKRWKSWAQCHRMSVLPATDCQVALYLQYTGDTVGSKASTEEACNALAWVHSVEGLSSPVVSPIVKAILEVGNVLISHSTSCVCASGLPTHPTCEVV